MEEGVGFAGIYRKLGSIILGVFRGFFEGGMGGKWAFEMEWILREKCAAMGSVIGEKSVIFGDKHCLILVK